ncbi:hypothetical protein T4E_3955 [Trichinella pseudospiralis]|uniref:Uncharacterized protein n=1 Tax=Trichinella pseudospiralis TaxID=6337 RepID=A0A0V0YGG8_TRIPS|nr:hypothetical protein T4E_3955 [Trichinella pseudospiralis]
MKCFSIVYNIAEHNHIGRGSCPRSNVDCAPGGLRNTTKRDAVLQEQKITPHARQHETPVSVVEEQAYEIQKLGQ